MRSPYPFHYTLRWLYYYLYPSTKNHSGITPGPIARELRPAEGRTFRAVFFGDLMCLHGDKVPRVDPAIAQVFAGADLVAGNLEGPIIFEAVRPEARYFGHFTMARDFLAELLSRLGVDPTRAALTLANNHIVDRGEEGIASTCTHLAALGATPFGHVVAGAPPLVVIERGGLRVGLAGWTHWMNVERYRKRGLVHRTDEVRAHDWRTARRELGLDLLIGSPHWEYEWQHYPRRETRALARELTTAGFDAIIGHHPHVLQPIEWLDPGLVLYSTGNLDGPPKKRPGWPVRLIALLEVRFLAEGPAKGAVQSYRVHPFAQEITALGEVTALVPLDQVEPELRGKLRQRLELLFPAA